LTTAAGLWTVAGLGMAFGMGFFSLGAVATALVLIILTFMKKLDPVVKKDRFLTLSVTALHRDNLLEEMLSLFSARDLEVSDISSQLDLVTDELSYQMVITQQKRRIGHELMAEIKQLEGVRKIRYH